MDARTAMRHYNTYTRTTKDDCRNLLHQIGDSDPRGGERSAWYITPHLISSHKGKLCGTDSQQLVQTKPLTSCTDSSSAFIINSRVMQ